MYTQKISDFIDTRKAQMTQHLQELMRIPSVKSAPLPNMPYGKEIANVQVHLRQLAEELGLIAENFENRMQIVSMDNRPKKLGILCHLDVVEVNAENWSTPPFEPTVKGNMIYGRGADDNKGAGIAALYALYAIKELQLPLTHGVGIYYGADEECGSSDLKAYLQKHTLPEHVFVPDAEFPVCTFESGLIRLRGTAEFSSPNLLSAHVGTQANIIPDEATAMLQHVTTGQIEQILSEISGIQYKVTDSGDSVTVKIHGKSAHASEPANGINAATALLTLLAQTEGGIFAKLSALFGQNMLYGEGFGFNQDQLTLALTILHYENGQLEIMTDSRVAASECSATAAEKMIAALPLHAQAVMVNEPHSVPEDAYIVKTLMDIYKKHTGREDKPYSMPGLTYAHSIPNAVAFGAIFPEDGSGGAHSADERYNLDSMAEAAKIFAAAMLKICGA